MTEEMKEKILNLNDKQYNEKSVILTAVQDNVVNSSL
jgi:hypothetical protein